MFWLPVLVYCFGGLFVWVDYLLAGEDNVTTISKGPPLTSVTNYRPISVTSVLSKMFERLVSVGDL